MKSFPLWVMVTGVIMSMMGTGSNFRSMWKFVLNMLSKMVSED